MRDDGSRSLTLVLIGMMGSGKTTVGRLLAARLSRQFHDLDNLIEQAGGMTAARLFLKEGEARFRQLERNQLLRIMQLPDLVLATGGGVVLDLSNRELLRQTGQTIFLQASVDTLTGRLRDETAQRPLLAGARDLKDHLARLWQERESLYREVAHYTVVSDDSDPPAVVETIISELGI